MNQSQIPPLDLTRQYAKISEKIDAAVNQILSSGRYIGGSIVDEFEQQFAAYLGVSECVSCNSGTDALFLALRAFDIGPGDEVITTPFTFFATAEVISAVGATPVFIDIGPDSFNFDLELLEAAITEKTKAIMPVHIFGQPVDMTRLMAIARRHNLIVIEDCAQAAGAQWQGEKVGSIGDVGCFSFFPTKNLGACGDGGALIAKDGAIASRVRMLKNHGQSGKYYSEEIGINSRLDALQAAILLVKLPYLDTWNDRRRAIADRYSQFLRQIPGVIPPEELPGGRCVWHQYTIRLESQPEENFPLPNSKRDWIRSQLQQRGIGSMVYYPVPLHLQPIYKTLDQLNQFPVVEGICDLVLSLPMFPEILYREQEQVIYGLKDCWQQIF